MRNTVIDRYLFEKGFVLTDRCPNFHLRHFLLVIDIFVDRAEGPWSKGTPRQYRAAYISRALALSLRCFIAFNHWIYRG